MTTPATPYAQLLTDDIYLLVLCSIVRVNSNSRTNH